MIGRRFSAAVKVSCVSSLLPSTHATPPHAWSEASVPKIAVSGGGVVGRRQQLQLRSALSHHGRSAKKESVTSRFCNCPWRKRTRHPRLSTVSPAKARSMACMYTRPWGCKER